MKYIYPLYKDTVAVKTQVPLSVSAPPPLLRCFRGPCQYDQSLMSVEQISRKRCSENAVGIEKINENSHGTKRLRPPDKLPTENSEAVEENSSSVFGLVMLFNSNKNVLILSIVQESLILTREL